MKALVIGYGSIGSRHARVLTELGCEVSVVSKRQVDHPRRYATVAEALQLAAPEYVVIANQTNEHLQTIAELATLGFTGTVMVEKPLFDTVCEPPPHSFRRIYVAYNLRFHPVIEKLRDALTGEKLLSVQVYVGQYLPTWRPGTDYRDSYSASKALGGGALHDLSHELDYLNWLLGGWERLVALGGQMSHLEIDSDDLYALMMQTKRCPVVTVQLNYLDRVARREIIINTDKATIKVDLIQGTLQINDQTECVQIERDTTYRAQHQAVISGEEGQLCSLLEGLDVMRMIQAAEKSEHQKVWITK